MFYTPSVSHTLDRSLSEGAESHAMCTIRGSQKRRTAERAVPAKPSITHNLKSEKNSGRMLSARTIVFIFFDKILVLNQCFKLIPFEFPDLINKLIFVYYMLDLICHCGKNAAAEVNKFLFLIFTADHCKGLAYGGGYILLFNRKVIKAVFDAV